MKSLILLLIVLVCGGCEELNHAWNGNHDAMIAAHENQLAQEQQRRDDYVAAHPNLETNIVQKITSGNVCVGMTEDEVRASWGGGEENSSGGLNGSFDQWFYPTYVGICCSGTYLYFKNGTLVSWQKSN